jgi:catechol 2,3-dioxygenase-like lactoylglutathione lyase family enzyme
MTTPVRLTGVCLDCADAEALAAFYERLLGWTIGATDGEGWIAMTNPDGGIGLLIQAEPWYEPPVWPEEPGAQTKMLHFEMWVGDMDAAVAHALAAGAVEGPQPPGRDPAELRVMLDPAGHPFCLFTD